MVFNLEEKTLTIAGHELKIHELTTEEESKIRGASRVWNNKRTPETDHGKLDASMIYYSVYAETWPEEWGPFTIENIRKLPSKLTRKLLFECQALNVLDEDVSAFLDSRQQSPAPIQTAKIDSFQQ